METDVVPLDMTEKVPLDTCGTVDRVRLVRRREKDVSGRVGMKNETEGTTTTVPSPT